MDAMSRSAPIRVLIADDHLLFAETLATALALDERIHVVGLAVNGVEAVDLALLLGPDVVLMDLNMPLLDGVEATRRISERPDAPRVLVLTGSDEGGDIQRASAVGAAGYLTKSRSAADLSEALFGLFSLVTVIGSAGAQSQA
jgi:DNA-binding NarL/FixJ family response regulator